MNCEQRYSDTFTKFQPTPDNLSRFIRKNFSRERASLHISIVTLFLRIIRQNGALYSFCFFFWVLVAFARILLRADLAFMSWKRSKSLRPALLALAAMRLAQADSSHFLVMPSVSQAVRTFLERVEKAILMVRGVRWRFFSL